MTAAEEPISPRQAWPTVGFLAVSHMIVDGACNFLVARIAIDLATPAAAAAIVTTYNLLAFATQAGFGAMVDWLGVRRHAAVIGGAMIAAGCLLFPASPWAAIIVAGIGNSFFHVGAGGICMDLSRGNAAMPGVFVGPGDIGVIVGASLGWARVPAGEVFAMLTVAAVVPILAMKLSGQARRHGGTKARSGGEGVEEFSGAIGASPLSPAPSSIPSCLRAFVPLSLLLLCYSIAVRSFIGGKLTGPWLADPMTWAGISIVAMSAKLAGGLLADGLGWVLFASMCTVAAVPVVAGFGDGPIGVMPAMLLVQAAMPVTLAAIGRIFPRWPAFAFGLAATSISIGTLPSVFGWRVPDAALLGAQIGCAAAVILALLMLRPLTRRALPATPQCVC